ncbi:MAG: hypothetical protein COA78_37680 [Blastopirellula sp.]|nr:MAG: hypothetical protein COA78_37680 [Blastopirellula sp.]
MKKLQSILKTKSVLIASVSVAVWALLIGIMALVFENSSVSLEGGFLNWTGRSHLILMHLPIGMLFLIIIVEILQYIGMIEKFGDSSIIAILAFVFISSIGATILGFLLMGVESVAGKAMTLHMWTGLAVVILSFTTLIFRIRKGSSIFYYLSLGLSALLITAAGHYGGSMVHGLDYFSEYAPEVLKPVLLAGLSTTNKANTDAGENAGSVVERNVYQDYIHPILEAKCNNCHNENKINGGLRMDTYELLIAGADGSDYPTVIPGDPEQSELIVRGTLPDDDGEFMPPSGDALTGPEIAIIKRWIASGAKRDTLVSDLGDEVAVFNEFTYHEPDINADPTTF